MTEDCSKLGWNGTHADGKWTQFRAAREFRIHKAIQREDGHIFRSLFKKRNCDDASEDEASLSTGDTWAVFVR